MSVALLLIDVQRNMVQGKNPVPDAVNIRAAIGSLLDRARQAGVTVVQVQNDGAPGDPDEPFTEGWGLAFPVRSGDVVIRKNVTDAFAMNNDLGALLRSRGVTQVVIAGMQSDFCITATSRGALQDGFEVVLVAGAHATYEGKEPAADIVRKVETELAEAGVRVMPVAEVAFA